MKLLQVSLLFMFVMLVAHVAAYNLGSSNRRYFGKCKSVDDCRQGKCLAPYPYGRCTPLHRRADLGGLPKPDVPVYMSRIGPHHTEPRVPKLPS